MLGQLDLIDKTRMRRYLLEKTQHIVGGFSKGIGEPPGMVYLMLLSQDSPLTATDIMHAYLGLAALATIGEEELPAFDAMFCMSWKARENMKRIAWLN
jgi:geranylgeranyl transferase type-1 subunit beta